MYNSLYIMRGRPYAAFFRWSSIWPCLLRSDNGFIPFSRQAVWLCRPAFFIPSLILPSGTWAISQFGHPMWCWGHTALRFPFSCVSLSTPTAHAKHNNDFAASAGTPWCWYWRLFFTQPPQYVSNRSSSLSIFPDNLWVELLWQETTGLTVP